MIDPVQYAQTWPRILFLLDSPSDLGNIHQIESLSELASAREIHPSHIINTCSKCAYGVIEDFPAYDMIAENSTKKRFALHSISICFIHKLLGPSPSKADILAFAQTHRYLLGKQIQYLQPDIIISSASHTSELWTILKSTDDPSAISFIPSGYGVDIFRWLNAKVILFPQLREEFPAEMTYCLLEKTMSSYPFFKL